MIHWTKRVICLLLLILPLGMVRADDPKIISGPTSAGLPARAEAWTCVQGRLGNPTSKDQELLVTTSFELQSSIEFGQRLWVPAGCIREFAFPMRVGNIEPQKNKKNSLNLTGLVIEQNKNQPERSLSRELQVIDFREDQNVTNIIRSADTPESVTDLVIAVRQSILGNKRVGGQRMTTFPRTAQALDGLDALVMATKQIDLDATQQQALRQWLLHGGKIWIMLDYCDPAQISSLLGNDWNVTFIDQTQISSGLITGPAKPENKKWDQPVTLSRVLATDFSIDMKIDGWPMAMRRSIGQGSVLVTTIGGPAWYGPKKEASDGLINVSNDFFRSASHLPLRGDAVKQMLSQQMGRQIVSRYMVLAVLGALVVTMSLLAIFLNIGKHLERLAPISAVLAILCLIVMLLLSFANRGVVPLTVATMQLQRIVPDQNAANVWGAVNVYNPKGSAETGLINGVGSVVWPADNLKGSTLRRLVWTDVDHWQWKNLKLPSGSVMQGFFEGAATLPTTARALVEFENNVVKIHTTGKSFGNLTDVAIGSDAGTVPLTDNGSGQWSLTGAQLNATGGSSAIRSDQSTMREAVLQDLLSHMRLLNVPSLLGWSMEQGSQISLDGSPRYQQSSLVVLPLNFIRPAGNMSYVIPSAFLPFRSFRNKDLGTAALFNDKTRQWIGPNTAAQKIAVAFSVPAELLPLKIDSGKLTISIAAPNRRVEVSGVLAKGTSKPLTVESPSREAVFDLPGEALSMDANGEVIVLIHVSDTPDSAQINWKISHVQMSLNVTTAPPAAAMGNHFSIGTENTFVMNQNRTPEADSKVALLSRSLP